MVTSTIVPSGRIPLQREQLADFSRRWQIVELSLFGSVLRDDFRPDSDVDVLVTFAPGAQHGLFSFARMEAELERLVGRRVDLVSRRGVDASANPIRRAAILNSAEPLYVAR